MTLPPGSLALLLILLFWVVVTFVGIFLIVFPHSGRGIRKPRKVSDQNASYKV